MKSSWIIEDEDGESLMNPDLRLEKTTQIFQIFARNKDEVLREILEETFGFGFNLEEIVDHIKCELYPDKEVYFIHDKPVAEFHKIEYDFDEETSIMDASMKWRKL